MRKLLMAAGLGFAVLNAILWFSTPAIRQAVDASHSRLDAPWRPMIIRGVQELFVYFDPWLAEIVFPIIFTIGFACIPFLLWETNSGSSLPTISKPFVATALLLLCFLEAVWLLLIWIGIWCRGPFWQFYWPSEEWDPARVSAVNTENLSDYVWGHLLNVSYSNFGWLTRELPGFLLLATYFITGLTLILYRHWKNPQLFRLLLVTLLFQFAFLVPIKMACRYLFHLKYFVAVSEFFFNI